ncbi:MAG: sulfite exporter TauE/SafE family protein [Dehalococcoidia bacterium]|nr:sulfite exporter TauE/SafE family protein [Dehalococcoidia bacterium]MDD5495017.1 sulfite exporter TauE/SafE family protein [Dehalococcoidia bacterium]
MQIEPFLIHLFLLILVLVFAHTVETVLGFGATIIAMALGIYIFPLNILLPVLVILGVLQSAWLVGRWFRHIQWRVLFLKILPAAVVGMVIGIYYRTQVADYKQLLILLGIFIMAVSVLEIVLIYRTRAAGGSLPWYLGIPILVIGGIFHGIFATGGPLIVYYSSRELKEPADFRATISTLWLILNITLVFNLISTGQIYMTTLTMTGIVLPGLIAGIVLGSFMKFRTLAFKVLIYALLFIAGMLLFIQQIINY